ncbi:MAG TPA: DNA-processing protein DprA [Thermoanaerobaculia bacterium]|nr:DNA-processing protein DprA [Thermoanaerobaculia bacterium]
MDGAASDARTGLIWARKGRGRAARALRTLLLSAGSPAAVRALSPEVAARIAGEDLPLVAPLFATDDGSEIREDVRRLTESGTRVLFLTDPGYPTLLREIHDPPPVLFARGGPYPDAPAIAVVGARRASRAGLESARILGTQLAEAGVTIVSGFARGVDAAAHRAALGAGGKTIAVFGCGVDVCYPPEQKDLLETLLSSGTALSEFPMGTVPEPWNFPIRNRILAGLARIVCVVEAAEKSGSLITARYATGYGRDVAAVPGSILSSGAAGSNALLKDGAILVRNADDLLAELPEAERRLLKRHVASREDASVPAHLSPDAAALFAALEADEPKDADALLSATGLSAARFAAALVHLELEGLVTVLPGALFVRPRARS